LDFLVFFVASKSSNECLRSVKEKEYVKGRQNYKKKEKGNK
jgi:hypothetical protein